MLKLVCQGAEAPVAIASGGRYDGLVERFGGAAAGLGFGFDVEAIRDLLGTDATAPQRPAATLVAYRDATRLAAALALLEQLHAGGVRAELLHQGCSSAAEAEAIAVERGCAGCRWVD